MRHDRRGGDKASERSRRSQRLQRPWQRRSDLPPRNWHARGLESGVERLRGQLRDTAQYGQRDKFGGDTLEDTAMGGFRRGTRGVERLLKGRKQGQKKEKFPAQNNSGTPSDAPSTGEKRGTGSLRIKTREAVLEQATAERGSGIVRPRPGPEKVRTGAGSLGSERPVEPCARPAQFDAHTPGEGQTSGKGSGPATR